MPTNLIATNLIAAASQPASSGNAQINQWLQGFIEIAKVCVIFAGGYFSHWLLLRRDATARRRELNLATSDFEVYVNKWLERIDDRKEQMVLPSIYTKSITELESVMRTVRGHLSIAARSQLDEEWKNYQRIERNQLDSVPTFDPVTKCTVPVYDKARRLLSEPLHKILEIVHEANQN